MFGVENFTFKYILKVLIWNDFGYCEPRRLITVKNRFTEL